MEFSTRGMKLLLQDAGDKRVSQEAADALADYLEEWGRRVAAAALEEAEKDGRTGVRKEDIRAALHS